SGGFSENLARRALEHTDPFVRLWTIRLLGDANSTSDALAKQIAALAATEPNVEARAQLACAAKRLPARAAMPIIRNLLARHEDAGEKRLPLLLWWAIESKCETNREAVLELFKDRDVWRLPVVREHILERLMRRFATAGTRRDLLTCAELLRLSPGPEQTQRLISGFELAFKGRSLSVLPPELVAALGESGDQSTLLGIRLGRTAAIETALKTISAGSGSIETRA